MLGDGTAHEQMGKIVSINVIKLRKFMFARISSDVMYPSLVLSKPVRRAKYMTKYMTIS